MYVNKRIFWCWIGVVIFMFLCSGNLLAKEEINFFYTSHCSSCHYAQEVLNEFDYDHPKVIIN